MIPIQLVSADAQRALEDFSEQFTSALASADVDAWARNMGLYHASSALKTTYPIPVSAAGYRELDGDLKYRALYQRSLTLVPRTWQDGVAELASIVEAPDFIGWAQEPAAIAASAQQLPNRLIAELLESNPECWTGENFFSTNHPVNVFDSSNGTFSNVLQCDDTSAKGIIAAIANGKQRFRSIKRPSRPNESQLPLGLRMTHVLVPPALAEVFSDALSRDLIIDSNSDGSQFGAVDNRHKGTVAIQVCDELSSDDTFYALALGKPGMYPWIVQDEGAPEEILHDKSSALYKTQLKVGVAYVLRANAALALPHAVQQYTIGT